MFRFLVVATALLLPAAVQAQHCFGRPSFRQGPALIGAAAAFGSGAQEFGVGAAVGSAGGLFGGASVSLTSFDNVDEEVLSFSAIGGAALPQGKIELCPFVTFSYAQLPELLGITPSLRTVAAGFAIGGEVASSPTMAFLPFADIRYGQTRLSSGGASFSDTGGAIGFGGGLLMNRTLAIAPSIAFPIGGDGGDPVFGISLSLLVGRR